MGADNANMLFLAGGTPEKMRLTSAGFLGIGLISPTTLLHVDGNATINENLFVAGNLSVDDNTLFVDDVNNRVGIITTAPTQTLDVRGNLTSDDGSGGGACLIMRDTDDAGNTYCTFLDGVITCSQTVC